MVLVIEELKDYNKGMEEEKTCKHCHRPLNSDFQFCPYCGILRLSEQDFKNPNSAESADDHESLDKLDVLEACLDVLDSEISQFLATNIH